jgi:hypothetical protein
MSIKIESMVRASSFCFLRRTIAMVLSGAALTILVGCSGGQQPASDRSKISPVAQNAPKMQPIPAVAPKKALPRVPSQGDCAPRYANGGRGACINNQPCRGFGVRLENGSAACTCYGIDGGCKEGGRCDAMRLACVPENTPPFGRGDID